MQNNVNRHERVNRMNEILHIVGNRPQFIKLAPVVKAFETFGEKQVIIHTGQHYDANMSDVFFEELGIPRPDQNLHIGSGSHAEMTGKAMIALEKAIIEYNPKLVVVYGDTNSTLAGALACRKLNYPLCHIEAGTRSYNRKNPEETNRVIIDHISDFLFCPDKESVDNLKKEGIIENVFFCGDVMLDIFNMTANEERALDILRKYNLNKNEYYLMTWHRQENTSSVENIRNIMEMIRAINVPIICPMHPRTENVLKNMNLWEELLKIENFICIEPVGYNEMVTLNRESGGIICDSGGLSKEAYYAEKKCMFTLDLVVWPDLIKSGWLKNYVGNTKEKEDVLKWFLSEEKPLLREDYYGNGKAAVMIAETMTKILNGEKE